MKSTTQNVKETAKKNRNLKVKDAGKKANERMNKINSDGQRER